MLIDPTGLVNTKTLHKYNNKSYLTYKSVVFDIFKKPVNLVRHQGSLSSFEGCQIKVKAAEINQKCVAKIESNELITALASNEVKPVFN